MSDNQEKMAIINHIITLSLKNDVRDDNYQNNNITYHQKIILMKEKKIILKIKVI